MSPRTRKMLALAALAVTLTACRANTQSNEVAVHVNGYDLIPTSKTIAGCIPPGKNTYIGMGDSAYLYPAGQRTFTFDDKGGELPAVSVVSSDNVTMKLSGSISFSLNQDCKTLERFHQQIGSKRWGSGQKPAYVNDGYDGWTAMLDTVIGQPLKNSLTDDSSAEQMLGLYKDPAVRKQLEANLAQTLPQRIKDATGGEYFTNFRVILSKPQAPDATVQALEDSVNAQLENVAQKNRNTTALTSYAQIASCKHLGLSEATCFELFAVNSGKVSVLPIPAGSGVGVSGAK